MIAQLTSATARFWLFALAGALVLFGMFGAAGCRSRFGGVRGSLSSAGSGGTGGKAPIKVFLPTTPDLTRPTPPPQRPDGSFTVRGLLDHVVDLAGKDVTLHGVVTKLRACGSDDEHFCALPTHAVLTDSIDDSLHRITVVGARLKEMPGIEPGRAITIAGRVATISPDGRMVSLDGLLILPPPEAPSGETPVMTAPAGKMIERRARRARRRSGSGRKIRITEP